MTPFPRRKSRPQSRPTPFDPNRPDHPPYCGLISFADLPDPPDEEPDQHPDAGGPDYGRVPRHIR